MIINFLKEKVEIYSIEEWNWKSLSFDDDDNIEAWKTHCKINIK
jgi:hypothetical protein